MKADNLTTGQSDNQTSRKGAEALAAIYAKIPKFICKPGCTDCCGPVPFSKTEWSVIKDKRTATCLDCPYSAGGSCAIYENRPFLCRIFGASEEPRLRCPHGCKPVFPLSIEETKKLTAEYIQILRNDDAELLPTIGSDRGPDFQQQELGASAPLREDSP